MISVGIESSEEIASLTVSWGGRGGLFLRLLKDFKLLPHSVGKCCWEIYRQRKTTKVSTTVLEQGFTHIFAWINLCIGVSVIADSTWVTLMDVTYECDFPQMYCTFGLDKGSPHEDLGPSSAHHKI